MEKSLEVVRKPIIIVQGGQYGSEAKGLITAKLGHSRNVDVAIRTGTVNAGHTVYYEGKAYAMQQLPVGWTNPDTKLVLGPGAYIHPEILKREIEWIREATNTTFNPAAKQMIYVDRKCGLHLPEHTSRSSKSGRHHSMGATGKGSSEAVIDKIYGRGESGHSRLFADWLEKEGKDDEFWQGFKVCDTVGWVNHWHDKGEQILIEGTQGTLLDLHLGPYPYTTHKQTQAASWMAEAGLSCALPCEIVLVMRTYPIRVAGNSGPLPQECSWGQLAGWINDKRARFHLPPIVDPVAVATFMSGVNFRTGTMGDPAHWSDADRLTHAGLCSEVHREVLISLTNAQIVELKKLFEMTTVTKKLRRIAQWNWEDATRSVMLNRPSWIALTFMNYEFPEAWGITRPDWGKLSPATRDAIYGYIKVREDRLGVKVGCVGFGPQENQQIVLYPGEAEFGFKPDHLEAYMAGTGGQGAARAN